MQGQGITPKKAKKPPGREICGIMSGPHPIMTTPNTKTVLDYEAGVRVIYYKGGWIFVVGILVGVRTETEG